MKTKTIGYVRVSTDSQDMDKQKYLLHEHANKQHIFIDDFISVAVSSRRSQLERKITELLNLLEKGDKLLVAELSRLGRDMFETLSVISALVEKGIEIVFVRQPELSTTGAHGKLLLAIYSYFAEAERDFIVMRTKQGLAAARAKGVTLGRRKGCRNKRHRLDGHRDVILENLLAGIPLKSILRIVNKQVEDPVGYTTMRYYVINDSALSNAKLQGKGVKTV
jgi:DNA invertase Pin-like site-specific DNA recombinase